MALVGESGSGKSVTSLAILGLLPPENSIIGADSEILFGGRNVLRLLAGGAARRCAAPTISMIFQEPMTSLNPVFTVGFQLTEVLRLHMGMTPAAGEASARSSCSTRSASPIPSTRSTRSRRRCRAASSSG